MDILVAAGSMQKYGLNEFIRTIGTEWSIIVFLNQRMGKTTMPTIVHWLKMAVLYGFETSCMWFREQGVTKEITGFMFDITESKCVEDELAFSKKSLELSNFVLEKLAAGEALKNIFDVLTLGAEKNISGAFASILLLDDSGTRLFDGSTPSFSQELRDAFNGLVIGPLAASCGTAAYTKQIISVSDISVDPRWGKFKDFASTHGLKSCHSAPILGSNGTVFGTFALTFKETKCLTDIEFEILQASAHIAALAIEQKRNEESIQIYAQELEDFVAIASHDFQLPSSDD